MKNKQADLVQIAGVLRDLEIGLPEAEICERHGITAETLRAWCDQYGQNREERVARMRALEEENARLRRLTKELAADKEVAERIIDKIEQMERKERK
jgi:putative transposase